VNAAALEFDLHVIKKCTLNKMSHLILFLSVKQWSSQVFKFW